MNKDMKYIEKEKNYKKVIRTEILFTPLLISLPIIVSFFLFYDWYTRGLLLNNPAFNGELLLAAIILFGNIIFDIPFLKSLIKLSKKRKSN